MIERIESSRPPGVSMRTIATVAPLSLASPSAWLIHACVAGSIVFVSSIEYAKGPRAGDVLARSRATPQANSADHSVQRM